MDFAKAISNVHLSISKRTLKFIFQVKVIWKVKCNNWSNRAQIECHMAGPHALSHEVSTHIYIY